MNLNIQPINIYMISYFFDDTIIDVISAIHKYTKHPVRIIVGDNYSKNSEKIRSQLNELLENNLIYAAYFYENNHGTKIIPHMFQSEHTKYNTPISSYTIVSDGDCLLSNSTRDCWLTDFINEFNTDKGIGIIGFQTKNDSLPDSIYNLKNSSSRFIENPDFTFKNFSSKEISDVQVPPCRGHLLTINTELFKKYLIECPNGVYDGDLQKFASKNNYSVSQYYKTYTYNLGTVKGGYDIDGLSEKYKFEKEYRENRIINWQALPYPKNYTRIK
jgi:hypothetical protein